MKTSEAVTRLKALEAERAELTIELRCELLRAAKELLPTAIAQAKPNGKIPGSPALLRLVSRIAMRDIRIERGKDR